MRFGEVRNPLLNIFELLAVYAIFFVTGKIWESLIPKVMKAYSWDTPPIVVPTESITPEQK
jgi:accessory gene regulator protein AgrB